MVRLCRPSPKEHSKMRSSSVSLAVRDGDCLALITLTAEVR
jgi:hypothetical protein